MYRPLPLLACALVASILNFPPLPVAAQDAGGNSLRDSLSPISTEIIAPSITDSLADPSPTAAQANSDESDESAKPEEAFSPQPPELKADLEARLKALETAALSDEDKRKAAAFYQQAIDSFEVANQQLTSAREFQDKLRLTLEDPKKSLTATAAKLAAPLPPYEDVSGETLEQVEKRATLLETSLSKYRQELADMVDAPKYRSQRMAELPKQVAAAQQKLKQTSDELAALGGEDLTDTLSVARRAALTQSEIALKATLYALRQEQLLYEQTGEWVKVRRDYFARYVPHKEKRLAQLREQINRRREDAARQQARQAAQAVKEVQHSKKSRPKAITDLATRNKVLAEERAKLVGDITLVSKQLDKSRNELLQLNEQFDRAKKQDQVDELSHLNGRLLREQQTKLPDLRALRRRRAQRDSERVEILLRIYHLNDDASALVNVDEQADALAAQSGDLSEKLRAEFRQLLTSQREIIDAYSKDCESYSKSLADLDNVESEIIAKTTEYAEFIAQRVLWIRSCAALSPADVRPAAGALAWSLNPRNWRDAGAAILQAGGRQPGMVALFAIAFAALAASQGAARRRLREFGEEADKRSCTKLQPTIHALWLTAILALPWPALLAFLGWSLDSLSESEFVRALSTSLRFTAVCLLLLEITRHLCRHGGLADAHFDWPDACLIHLRRKLRWLTVIGLPLSLWLVGLETQAAEPLWSSSLGRLCFIAVMLLLAAVFHRVLLAAGSPFRRLKLFPGGGWLTPLQIVWRPTVVLLPVALAILAGVGYYFTAQQAALRVLQTVAMLLAVATLGGVTRRWLLVNRRRLAREQARQRRAQLAAAAETDAAAPPTPELADDSIDLAAVSEQTQKLVRTFLAITTVVGLALIWGEILPALAYPAGTLLPGAEALTWGHLATFLFVLGVTYVSVRDVPALLELVVLQHLPLDSGARYAFTSISRYLISAIGITVAFNSILMKWGDIQWLVAAMSVGLGFGLQEIFANFVSGIILLFERPIRVGDIVTLGETSGVVNRIRMRSTTIVDWDRKEYIVPNKDLVTERLLNWTLSDNTNRIVVNIGVAYGSDTQLACDLLLEAAREQPHVLKEPPPVAFFDNFGESSLNLKLLCFLPNLENRWQTIHAMNTAISAKFKAAGLEIPFPQRDLNVRFNRERFAIDLEGSSIALGDLPSRRHAAPEQQASAARHGAA